MSGNIERCHVSVTGKHRIDTPYCKDCGQEFPQPSLSAAISEVERMESAAQASNASYRSRWAHPVPLPADSNRASVLREVIDRLKSLSPSVPVAEAITVEEALKELREMFPDAAFHIDVWNGPDHDFCNLTVLDRPPDTHVMWTETRDSLAECVASARRWANDDDGGRAGSPHETAND